MSNYTNLKNYEKAERLFFQLGKFTLKNVVLMNNASGNNNEKNKLDVIYKRDYPSTKYNNMDQLSQLKVRTSDFLVFAYNDFSVKPIVNEEIYTSYNHLIDVMNFFYDIDEQIIQQEEMIYNDAGTTLTELGNNITITSQPFVQGKMMSAIPVINVDASNNIQHQIAIFFDNNNYYEIFNFKNIHAIIATIDQINLPTISGQTLIISMLDAIERQTRYSGGSRYNNNYNNGGFNNQGNDEENGQVQDTRFLNRNIPSSNGRGNGGSSIPRRSISNNNGMRPRPNIHQQSQQQAPVQQNNQNQEPVQQPQNEQQSQPTQQQSRRRIGIGDIKSTAQTIDVSDLSNVEEIDV